MSSLERAISVMATVLRLDGAGAGRKGGKATAHKS
jgi:hypothetical protein